MSRVEIDRATQRYQLAKVRRALTVVRSRVATAKTPDDRQRICRELDSLLHSLRSHAVTIRRVS